MDELAQAQAISLQGADAEAALAACRAQLTAWQIAVPEVEPLVLDFGLGRFAEVGLIEFWIANEAAAGYCGKYLYVMDSQICPLHRHRTKKETFFVVKGSLQVVYGGEELRLAEGDVLPVEPWTFHSFGGCDGPALLLELSMPCEIADNYFADRRIPIGGNYKGTIDRGACKHKP